MIMFFAIVGMVVVGLTAVTTAVGLSVMGLVAITERRAPRRQDPATTALRELRSRSPSPIFA
jgi:hypothetical protein